MLWRRGSSEPKLSAVTTTPIAVAAGSAERPTTERRGIPLPVVASLGAVYIVWSSTYLALRYVVDAMPPLLSSGARYLLAGVLLHGFLRLRGSEAPSAKQWLAGVVPGALLFLCGNGFVALAERDVASGLAAVACAGMPLILAVLGALGGDKPRTREWVGLGLGFTGVFLLGAGNLGGSTLSSVLLMLAPLGWALGSLLTKRLPMARGIMGASTQMIAGGVVCLFVGALRGESIPSAVPTSAVLAFGYLVVFGSLVAFSAYSYLLGATRPAVATSYAYVNPVLAVGLGVALGGERPGPSALAATLLVALGVAVLATGKRDPVPERAITRS